MLILEINGKEKEIPCQWEEMTIDYYCGIYQIINKYKKTEEQKEEEKEKNLEKFYFVQETKMYKELFSYMTEIPMEMVDQANMSDVEKVINSLDNIMKKYEPKGIDSFTYDNEIYYFPFEFMKTGTFGDYIEANQLELSTKYLKNGRFDILPEQMAILCKKVDEEVDLDNIDEKAKKFKNLTMDIVWEFSFFLSKRTIKSLSVIQTFSEMAAQKA
jgi:hypothetical protein